LITSPAVEPPPKVTEPGLTDTSLKFLISRRSDLSVMGTNGECAPAIGITCSFLVAARRSTLIISFSLDGMTTAAGCDTPSCDHRAGASSVVVGDFESLSRLAKSEEKLEGLIIVDQTAPGSEHVMEWKWARIYLIR
jgi:hypothetical protein